MRLHREAPLSSYRYHDREPPAGSALWTRSVYPPARQEASPSSLPPLDLQGLPGYSLAAAADQAIAGDPERSGPREESPSSTGQGAG